MELVKLNHAFIDGNKRVAFLAGGFVFGMNGYKLKATQMDVTLTMLAVASGEMLEADFATWIRASSTN
jgi:death-on-curing protein